MSQVMGNTTEKSTIKIIDFGQSFLFKGKVSPDTISTPLPNTSPDVLLGNRYRWRVPSPWKSESSRQS
jgi:hypothetical protein